MLIQRKVKATQRCVVHVHKATYSYYICTWCDVGVHYAITGLHVYTDTGTSCGSFRCVSVLLEIRLGSTIFGQ